jgi:hypothetical protein
MEESEHDCVPEEFPPANGGLLKEHMNAHEIETRDLLYWYHSEQ